MPQARLHDGTVLNFPDGTDEEVINRTVKNFVDSRKEKAQQETPEEMGTVEYGLGLAPEIVKGFGRGFGKGILSGVGGLAEIADSATDLIGLEGLIDSGDENALINLANKGKKSIDETIGVGDEYKDNYLVKLGEGFGSIASFFVPGAGAAGIAGKLGAGAKAAGLIGTSSAVGIGAGTGADDQAQRIQAARDKGLYVSDDAADLAVISGGLVGASEAVTPLRVLKKIKGIQGPQEKLKKAKKDYDDFVKKGNETEAAKKMNEMFRLNSEIKKVKTGYDRIKSAFKEGSVEAIQESVSSVLQESIEYGLYNENVDFGESLWDDITVGGGAGALLDYVGTGVANRRKRITRDVDELREQQFRDEEDVQSEAFYDQAEAARLQIANLQNLERQNKANILGSINQPQKLPAIIDPYSDPTPTQVGDRIIVFDVEGMARTATVTDVTENGKIIVESLSGEPQEVGVDTVIENASNPNFQVQNDFGVKDAGGKQAVQFDDKELDALEKNISNILKTGVEDSSRNLVLTNLNAVRNEKVRRRSDPFESDQPYKGRARNDKEKAIDYANQIAKDAVRKSDVFPSSGKFEIVEEKRGQEGSVFKVVNSVDGKQYGETSLEYNFSAHLAANLNNLLINTRINEIIIDAMDVSPETYTEAQSENIFRIGQKLKRPNRYTVTSAALNEAAGTTTSLKSAYREDLSIDQLHLDQYNVLPYNDRGEKLYNDLNNLTASQTINFERRKKGLPEQDEFTLQEAKEVLGDKYPDLFDVLLDVKKPEVGGFDTAFGTVGAKVEEGRRQYQDEKRTLEEINEILKSKNIMSGIETPEVQYIFERIVNESDVKNMSPSQREYLVEGIKNFPIISEPAILPDFRPKSYSKEVYDATINYVLETGDGSKENIEGFLSEVISVDENEKFAVNQSRMAEDLTTELKRTGLINEDQTVNVPPDSSQLQLPLIDQEVFEPRPYQEPDTSEEAKLFEQMLSEDLKGFGLEGIRLRILDGLRVPRVTRDDTLVFSGDPREARQAADADGFYINNVKTIFLGLDNAKKIARDQTPESRRAALADVLDHEILHALRDLDLWTDKEWSLLENLAKKKIHEGGTELEIANAKKRKLDGEMPRTFFGKAREDYRKDPRLNEVDYMEEAIAEIIRVGRKDRSLITGKPRSLVNRLFEFFERTHNALKGSGFQNFNDIMNRLESGEIGKREKGVIRSLRATEKKLAAIPERGIGPTADVVDLDEVRERDSSPKILQAKREKPYVGAPKELTTPQDLARLRRSVKSLAKEGVGGRFWYEQSGKALLELTGGDKVEASKIAQAIAITSPQTPVPTNFNYAIQAYYQHKTGKPIKTGMFPTEMSKKLTTVFNGGSWEGRKTNNFYNNLMREIDPKLAQGVTTDLWMMRAFGYFKDAPLPSEYDFVENETKKIADKLGWEPQQVQAAVWVAMKARAENKSVKTSVKELAKKAGINKEDNPGEYGRILYEQAMLYDPTSKEKDIASFDFSNAIELGLAQISWESIPGKTSKHMADIFYAPYNVLAEYHQAISSVFLDKDGRDYIAKRLGLLSPKDFEAPGFFEGKVSPGTQTEISSPKKYKADKELFIEASTEELINAYAAIRGILMKQDGVGWHRPFKDKSLTKSQLNAIEINIGRPFSKEETKELAESMNLLSGHEEYAPIATESGARLINFDYLFEYDEKRKDNSEVATKIFKIEQASNLDKAKLRLDSKKITEKKYNDLVRAHNKKINKVKSEFHDEFNNMAVKSLNAMSFKSQTKKGKKIIEVDIPVDLGRFNVQAGYLGNNWEKNSNGESYIESLASLSPDIQRRVQNIITQLQPRIDAIDSEFSKKYNWKQNSEINEKYRSGDFREGIKDEYRRLESGEITQEQYDTAVLDTISEYSFVPEYATEVEMQKALRPNQQNRINQPIQDGLLVGLRLDINAYLRKVGSAWVPTIHDEGGKAVSHKATASISNVDFTKSPTSDLQESSQRVMKGKPKSPFAQISGNFINRTDSQNKALAEEALNSPEWTQVGFDPRRHSYFYDRKTGEPVTVADEVIQVGPLVLAKNVTKNVLPSGEMYTTRYKVSDKDESLNVEERINNANQLAEDFSKRNQGLSLSLADQNPEVQRSVIEQELNDTPPFSWQSRSHALPNYSNLDKFIYQIQDKFVGLKNIRDDINSKREEAGLSPIDIKDDPYIGEESIPGKIGKKAKDFELKRKKPIAEKIAKSGVSLEEVDQFLTLRHAIERNNLLHLRDPNMNPEEKPGSGSLRTGEELTNSFVKRKMQQRYDMVWDDATSTWSGGNSKARKLLDIAADTDRIANETMQVTVDGGLIDPDSANAILNTYKYYTPLRGKDMEDDYAENVIVGSGLSTKGKDNLRALGRESAAQSPLGHILLNAERAISRAEKNKTFGQKLVSLVKNNPNPDFWQVIDSSNPRYKRDFETKYTYVGSDPDLQGQKFTNIPDGMNKKEFIKQIVIRPDNLGVASDPDLIGVKIDGNQVYVEIKDKRLLDAIVSMDIGTADGVIQKLGLITRFLSFVNTSLNPEFVIGNFSRDVETAIFNILGEQEMSEGKAKDQKLIQRVLKDTIPSIGAFYKGITNKPSISIQDKLDFDEFISAGSKADWFHSRPPEDQVKTINSMIDMANGTLTGEFKKRYTQVMDFVEDTNSSVENGVRFATFKASRDEMINAGVDRDTATAKAASLAKNLTINFNRKGMKGDTINALYLFFNASVQGTANFARGLFGPKGNPFSKKASRTKQGAVAGLIGFGALTAMRAEEESEEDPKTGRSYYSQIPDYVKERNIVIMNENGKDYYTIPLPYGYNTFHVLGQSVYEMGIGNISKEKSATNILSAFLGSFSPVGASSVSVAPTISQPMFEIAFNENFFGSEIRRENYPPPSTQLPESSLSRSTTRTIFKDTAKLVNELTGGNEQEPGKVDVSPDTLEHWAEFIVGGAGTFGLRTANAIEKGIKDEKLTWNEVPFIRRLKGEVDSRESMSDYFERRNKIKQKLNRLEALKGAERIKYRNENKSYVSTSLQRKLKRIEKNIRDLREERNDYQTKASKSPQSAIYYGKRVESIYDEMNDEYADFNKYYDRVVGRSK